MGGGASAPAGAGRRQGPPRSKVTRLTGEQRAHDLMELLDQDTMRTMQEVKQQAVLDELESAQAAAMVELTTRHVRRFPQLFPAVVRVFPVWLS